MLLKLWRLAFGSPRACAYEVECDGQRVRYEAASPADLVALVPELTCYTDNEPRVPEKAD